MRESVQAQARLCRGLLHLPDAAPPDLPDAVLRKIVFWEDERLFRPDRLGHFNTWRSVQVDEASHCEPFVWAYREASVTTGCDGQSVGVGHMPIEAWLPGVARPAPPPPEVKFLPEKMHPCPSTRKLLSADGLPRIAAGQGVECAWLSGMTWASLGPMQDHMPQANPGTGGASADPRPGRSDACMLAKRPFYRSTSLIGRPVEVMGHQARAAGGSADAAAVQFVSHNTHLVQYQEGGAIADAELSPERVKAFIEMPWREPLPSAN
jgi:hypothetical protein